VKGSDEILGGYNPMAWKSDYGDSYETTKDSFIFSFKTNDRIEDYVLSRVKGEKKATFNGYFRGPSFGEGDLDIWCGWQADCSSKKYSYKKPIREIEGTFFIKECEIFQIL